MLKLDHHTNHVTVHYHGQELGHITFSHNPYHQARTYLTLDFLSFPLDIAEQLFQSLIKESQLGFQVMLSSQEREKIAFLTAGGFTCGRKCFEVKLAKHDYLGPRLTGNLKLATRGQTDFDTCASLMFHYYQTTHGVINPWTTSSDEFYRLLPDKVYYTKIEDHINNLAFIEGNEMAYVTSQDLPTFQTFIARVFNQLFTQYDSICFEADDCDPFAMSLLSFCPSRPTDSWDTYLLDKAD